MEYKVSDMKNLFCLILVLVGIGCMNDDNGSSDLTIDSEYLAIAAYYSPGDCSPLHIEDSLISNAAHVFVRGQDTSLPYYDPARYLYSEQKIVADQYLAVAEKIKNLDSLQNRNRRYDEQSPFICPPITGDCKHDKKLTFQKRDSVGWYENGEYCVRYDSLYLAAFYDIFETLKAYRP